jgi:N-acetylated-alpha-linked acidic dipeptidase
MHVGVPSMSGGAGGPNVYHSNYDTFRFYEKFVDPEFQMGPMVEHMAGLMALRMANAESKINSYDKEFDGFKLTAEAINSLEKVSNELTLNIKSYLENDNFSKKELKNLNKQLIALEKSFISEKGMYFGSWFKSIYAASDPFSGYAAWILPGLEYEIALNSSERLQEWDSRYASAVNSLHLKMKQLILDLK